MIWLRSVLVAALCASFTGCAAPLVAPDREAVPIRGIEPVYPREALARCVTGHVMLEFNITSVGNVRDISVVDSAPRGVFEAAAAEALSAWRFMPAIRDGKAVNQRSRQRIEFTMEC